MIPLHLPENEKERLAALKEYGILDTSSEYDFDNITTLLAKICDVPISLITLMDSDRNFFKSHLGLDFNQSPRDISFCGHAILDASEIFIVENALKDERFMDNPLVKDSKAIFYAGVPLINPDGFKLGTLCVFDHKPRTLTEVQKTALISLATQTVNLLELKKKNDLSTKYQAELQQRNDTLSKFAHLVSHDLKSPLANITSLTRLLREENLENLSNDSEMYLDYIEDSSSTLKNYIDGILNFYKSDELLDSQKNDISLLSFFREIEEILITDDIEFQYPKEGLLRNVNKLALTQIFLNLIDNSLKYNLKKQRIVSVEYTKNVDFHIFTVTDNGMGIDLGVQEDIFNLFKTTGLKDRNGNEGTGIGLATVKNFVSKLGGTISLESELGKGSIFSFTIKK